MTTDESRFEELGREVTRGHADTVETLQDHLETHVDEVARRARKKPQRWMAGAAVAALAAAITLAILLRPHAEPTPEPAPSERVAAIGRYAPEAEELRLVFPEGSQVAAQAGSKLSVEELRDDGATVRLAEGTLEVAVRHRDNTRWQLRAGPYRVQVTGTRFELGWTPETESMRLQMREGSVLVTGPGGAEHRVTGEELLELRPTEPEPPREAEPEPEDATESPPPAAERAAPRSADWRTLARAGDYEEAFRVARGEGFERLLRNLDGPTLYELADTARFAGEAGSARSAYLAVRERHPQHPLAARAAFDLGVMSQGRPAIDWFEAYLREEPGGPLAREALGRLLELRVAAGAIAATDATARRYLERYPGGPHAALARAQLAP